MPSGTRRPSAAKNAKAPDQAAPAGPKPARARDNGHTSPRRRRFELDLEETAARLFAERGFRGTSLRDIADEIGMSRSSLYNYVTSKEELLSRLTTQFLEGGAYEVQHILTRDDLAPVDKLERMVAQIVIGLAERPSLAMLFEHHLNTLPEESRTPVTALRRSITDQLIEVIRQGAADGSFFTEDERIAAFVIGNIAVGSARWIRPGEHVQATAAGVARMAVRSLQQAEPTRPTPRSLSDAVAQLAADVEVVGRFAAAYE